MDDIEGILTIPSGTYAVTMRLMPAEAPPRKARKKFPKLMRDRLLRAQDHRCAICGGSLSFYESHIDHIIPLRAGGTDDFTNLQVTHGSCNLRKGGSIDDQERMPWAS